MMQETEGGMWVGSSGRQGERVPTFEEGRAQCPWEGVLKLAGVKRCQEAGQHTGQSHLRLGWGGHVLLTHLWGTSLSQWFW